MNHGRNMFDLEEIDSIFFKGVGTIRECQFLTFTIVYNNMYRLKDNDVTST